MLGVWHETRDQGLAATNSACVGSARMNVRTYQPLLQHVPQTWLLISSTIKCMHCWCELVRRSLQPHPSCCVAPASGSLPLQLRVCLPCLREVQLGYDRGNMDAITAAAPGWPALAGLVQGLDLRVYPGPLPAQTLAHLAHSGSGLTRLAISGELPEGFKRLRLDVDCVGEIFILAYRCAAAARTRLTFSTCRPQITDAAAGVAPAAGRFQCAG